MKQQQNVENKQDCNPNRLLDALIQRKQLKNDAALCRVLQVAPPLISKIRHGRTGISADVMIRMHDAFEIPISELRQLMCSD
jgi:plasmid maintenance system antidote protein VapI